jgi:hypothetical protein
MPDPEEISENIVALSAGDPIAGYWLIDLL